MIELQNVTKTYEMGETKLDVLKDVNVSIKKGESVAIMGPSGSGKSTLLNIIGCLDRPTKGTVKIAGRDVSKLNDDELAKIRLEKVGFVFQFFYLIPSLNAIKNIMLPMSFAGLSEQERENRAIELLKIVGLDDRMYHMPSQLSGGQRQRVAIARAMANDPEIILADEPTGNLDTVSGTEIINILMRLNKNQKTTLLLITHDKNISGNAQRIIHIKDGKIGA